MIGFLLRTLIVAAGLWLATKIFTGVQFEGPGTLFAAALLLGLINGVVRPIAVVLTFPITLLTLGLFLLVINAAMVGLVALLLGGMTVSSFWTALGASIIVSLTSWVASGLIDDKGRVEVIRRRDS